MLPFFTYLGRNLLLSSSSWFFSWKRFGLKEQRVINQFAWVCTSNAKCKQVNFIFMHSRANTNYQLECGWCFAILHFFSSARASKVHSVHGQQNRSQALWFDILNPVWSKKQEEQEQICFYFWILVVLLNGHMIYNAILRYCHSCVYESCTCAICTFAFSRQIICDFLHFHDQNLLMWKSTAIGWCGFLCILPTSSIRVQFCVNLNIVAWPIPGEYSPPNFYQFFVLKS